MSATKSFELWSRAENIAACSYIRDTTYEESENILEVETLRNQENKLSNAERMLKIDLIEAYSERKKRIEKLEKVLAFADEIKAKDKKLRTDIREIILADNECFTLCAKKTIVTKKKK